MSPNRKQCKAERSEVATFKLLPFEPQSDSVDAFIRDWKMYIAEATQIKEILGNFDLHIFLSITH